MIAKIPFKIGELCNSILILLILITPRFHGSVLLKIQIFYTFGEFNYSSYLVVEEEPGRREGALCPIYLPYSCSLSLPCFTVYSVYRFQHFRVLNL